MLYLQFESCLYSPREKRGEWAMAKAKARVLVVDDDHRVRFSIFPGFNGCKEYG